MARAFGAFSHINKPVLAYNIGLFFFKRESIMQKVALFFLSTFVFISTQALAAGNAAAGKAKSATCLACHGADGNSLVANFPKIAGQGEAYLVKQLKDFKSGARKDATMLGMVAALSEQDMQDLAAHFAAQPVKQGVAKKDANVALGQKLYNGGDVAKGVTACSACHGPNGAGIPSAGFPALASQHATYTANQLKAFRQVSLNAQTGDTKPARTNDGQKMMIEFTKNLNNDDIEALAQYIAGLH